jgi:hypothetical protein
MKKTRFTEEQIAAILKQSEAGMKTACQCSQFVRICKLGPVLLPSNENLGIC